MKKCAVIGSINMDMVLSVPRFPAAGETLTGGNFQTVPGGKGANQAVALGRLGAPVRMAGRVGDDAFGRRYLDHFRKNGVDVRAVDAVAGTATGVADILVNAAGENCIVIAPGANGLCDLEWLDRALEATADCEIFLLQLEIPLDTVAEAVRRLRKMGKTILLDPAPAVPLPEDVLSAVDFLTPNETELKAVTSGLPEDAGIEERVRHLVGGSGRVVVHKRGADGAYIGTRDGIEHVPGFSVRAVDTTAAGDTFNAGLAAGLAMGWPLRDAVRLANAAGALAVTAYGAQEGMPSLEQAQALMARG
ncbi:MAG TPA: ribokinase [Candidatus Faecivicinus avistercoris]|nr:ribokinase [Candidatus Faecivicinus avistercoris]